MPITCVTPRVEWYFPVGGALASQHSLKYRTRRVSLLNKAWQVLLRGYPTVPKAMLILTTLLG